ncbi:MAG: 2-oxoglutarate dehydrogenase complex dihydrolipoyllysine-residue succinyltransferase [Desulfosalsimonas sp.]
MKVDIKVPEVGESVKEAMLTEWFKSDGDRVEKDEPIFVLETDKVTLEVPADESGTLEILVQAGATVEVGTVVGKIDAEAAKEQDREKPPEEPAAAEEKEPAAKPGPEPEPVPKPEARPEPEPAETAGPQKAADPEQAEIMPPSVRRLVSEKGVDVSKISGTGPNGRITKGDVISYLESGTAETSAKQEQKTPQPADTEEAVQKKEPAAQKTGDEEVTRIPMSPIRKRIASHLLDAKQNTAMLTTFNEIDMSRIKTIREQFKDTFYSTHGVRLGFMSSFVKAVVSALKELPEINARIEGNEIVYHHYYHIGIAIGAKKGLVVPVIRHADRLGFAEIEKAIVDFAKRVEQNRISLSELEGGTFSITNGGIYGSLLSTPILNMPQSGILAMHKIEDRPVAIEGEVVIRPMMYVALSYDHRIVDGKDAVTFLRRIKEFIETPERMIMEI